MPIISFEHYIKADNNTASRSLALSPSNDSPDTLTGTLERIVFANEENHYTIGEFRPNGGGQPVTIAGNLPGVQCGETLELHGEWQRHPVHGPQFKIKGFTSKLDEDLFF